MEQKASILVVDDEDSMRRFFSLTLEREGHSVETAGSVKQALLQIENQTFDLVLSDIRLGDGTGLDVLRAAKKSDGEVPVIMMTAYASAETAVEAMKLGAADYLAKPFNVDEVKIVVRNNLRTRTLIVENRALREQIELSRTTPGMIFTSPIMERIVTMVDRVAQMDTTVLVTGESGTGKELVMRMLHQKSTRCNQPFVSINCGALPENLFESELFGYEKGAFTGADRRKMGLFETAHKGTLFLDEIGEMPLRMQVKLLRALQDHRIRRVGGTEELAIDVRVLAATNRNLENEVKNGHFREDLYYRINVIPIEIPPLRQRQEDIALLIHHFLKIFCKRLGEDYKEITPRALQLLENYAWPGNVRELENTMERLVALTQGPIIDVEHLTARIAGAEHMVSKPSIYIPEEGLDLESYLDDLRLQYMLASLELSENVQTRSCELLGMSFRSFRYYLSKARESGKYCD